MYGLYMNFRKYLQQNPHLLLLIIIVLFIILIIGRPYNLLVNDDGIFIRNVKNFYEGNFSLHPLTAPTFYLQALTGFITTKIFGFTFENLRILNIFFAFLSSLLIFSLIKSITKNKLAGLLVALSFVSNPFFWFLSYSYMTEIHFILFATIALFSFYKYLQNNSYSNVILTSIAVSLLFLVRQIGLIFAISFFLSIIITNKKITKKDLIIVFLPVLTFFWYQNFSITVEYAEAGITETLKNFFDYSFMINIFFKRLFDSSVYIGLFSFPLIPIIILNKRFKFSIKTFLLPTLIALPFIIKLIQKLLGHFTFPTLQNVFTFKGFYPSAIPSTDRFVNYPLIYNLHTSLLIIGVISFVVLIYLIFININILKKLEKPNKTIFIATTLNLLFITLLTLAFRAVYDRYIYLLFFLLLFPVSLIIKNKINNFALVLTACCLIIFSSTSIIFEKDYISWNQKRNEIITFATNQYNQSVCDIEGSGEWEDYLYYECKDIQDQLKKTLRISWQDSDQIENQQYIKLQEFPFKSYLGKQENKLYLLQKINNEN